ncbi:MAG: DUF3137 domain-containing protein [Anaerovoracaceae bacterium]
MNGLFGNQKSDVPKEQREAMARSYGEQGTKELMKADYKHRGRLAITFGVISILTLAILPPVGIGFAIAMIVVLTRSSKSRVDTGTDADTLYRVNFLQPALLKVFGEKHTFMPEGYLSDEAVFFAMPDTNGLTSSRAIAGDNFLSFYHGDLPVTFSHVTCRRYAGKDDDGDSKYEKVWDGQVFKTRYKNRINGYVRIVPTSKFLGHEHAGKYKKIDKSKEVKVETDNIFFNEHFDVYASNQQDALFVLNPIVINFLTDYYNLGITQTMYVNSRCLIIGQEGASYGDLFNTPTDFDKIDAMSVESKCGEAAKIGADIHEMIRAINGNS